MNIITVCTNGMMDWVFYNYEEEQENNNAET